VILASTEDIAQEAEANAGTGSDLVDFDSVSLESIGDISDIVEDLKVCTECLAELSPSLDNPAQDRVPHEEPGDISKEEFANVSAVALPFVLGVREKYSLATEQLVIRVGESIFRRWSKLRPSSSTNINPVSVNMKDE